MLKRFSPSRLGASAPRRFSCVLIAVLACCSIARGEPLTIADCLDATCKVLVAEGNGQFSCGTGCVFMLDGDTVYVLTAAHVVGRAGAAQCVFWRAGHESRPIAGRVAAANETPTCDAAVIALPRSAFGETPPRVIPLAPAGLRVAAQGTLASVGCAYGAWETAWQGHALGYAGDELQFVPPPAEGRSGAALIDLTRGCIVGVIRGRTTNESPSRGVAVSMDAIYGALMRQPTAAPASASSAAAATADPITGNPTRKLVTVQLPERSAIADDLTPTQCPGGVCPMPGGYAAPPTAPRTFLLPERERIDDRLRNLEARPYPTLPLSPAPIAAAPSANADLRPLPLEDATAFNALERRMGEVERRAAANERNIDGLTEAYAQIRAVGERLAQESPQVRQAIAEARGEAATAGRAADDAKQENLSLRERIEQRFDAVRALFWSWLPWLAAGVVVAVILGLIRRDVRQRVESGGDDKLAIERLAARTPWTWDDAVAAASARVLANVYGRIHPAAGPVSPPAAAPTPVATAAKDSGA